MNKRAELLTMALITGLHCMPLLAFGPVLWEKITLATSDNGDPLPQLEL